MTPGAHEGWTLNLTFIFHPESWLLLASVQGGEGGKSQIYMHEYKKYQTVSYSYALTGCNLTREESRPVKLRMDRGNIILTARDSQVSHLTPTQDHKALITSWVLLALQSRPGRLTQGKVSGLPFPPTTDPSHSHYLEATHQLTP